MSDLQSLAEREDADPEMIPRIIQVDSRLSVGMVTADLLSMVARVSALIPAKETIPGTSMMLIEAISEKSTVPYVRVSAWDGAQWMQIVSEQPVRVLTPGAAVVPGKKMLEALRLAPERVSKVSVIGMEAILVSGRAQWTFATPATDSLGFYPDGDEVDLIDVPAVSLRTALKAVAPAASTSNARAAFLQAHVADGSVTTTDGARMHRMQIEGIPERFSVDIPIAIVARVLDLLSDIEGDHLVQIGANDRRIHFHIGRSRVISQRILLPFPDVESIIVGAGLTNEKSFTVRTEDLRQSVKRVRINADPDRAALTLAVVDMPGGGWALAVHSRDANSNYAQESLDVQWTGSKPRDFSVNHKFLTDVLAQVPSEYTIVRVGDDTKTQKSPLLISDSGFQAVLAQIRNY